MAPTAVMFPGLGAEYPGMVSRFQERFPGAAAELRRWGEQVGADLAGEPEDERERQRVRQLSIHALNLLWWREKGAELEDAALCGHSLGFYAALVAAGVMDEDFSMTLVDTVFGLSWDAWADNGNKVMALTARVPLDPLWLVETYRVETLCVNAPTQLVVYGPPEAIAQVCRDLGDDLVRSGTLNSPIPFHSWSMGGVSAALRRYLVRDGWGFREPRPLLWSHIHARPIASAAAAAEAVVEQPRLPVRWDDTIRDLRRHGFRRFLQVGPNRVLARIVRWVDPRLEVAWVDDLR